MASCRCRPPFFGMDINSVWRAALRTVHFILVTDSREEETKRERISFYICPRYYTGEAGIFRNSPQTMILSHPLLLLSTPPSFHTVHSEHPVPFSSSLDWRGGKGKGKVCMYRPPSACFPKAKTPGENQAKRERRSDQLRKPEKNFNAGASWVSGDNRQFKCASLPAGSPSRQIKSLKVMQTARGNTETASKSKPRDGGEKQRTVSLLVRSGQEPQCLSTSGGRTPV